MHIGDRFVMRRNLVFNLTTINKVIVQDNCPLRQVTEAPFEGIPY